MIWKFKGKGQHTASFSLLLMNEMDIQKSLKYKTKYRIGISAQAFGFGPASKAAMIGTYLKERFLCELYPLANGVAYDYLKNEGIVGLPPLHPSLPETHAQIDAVLKSLDVIIIVLDDAWVDFSFGKLPVVFVDSLGFMWTKTFFRNSSLKQVDRYFVQDIFDAYKRVQSFGVENVVPVGAIVQEVLRKNPPHPNKKIVHLGGVLNIFNVAPIKEYLKGVLNLCDEIFNDKSDVQILMSDAGRKLANETNEDYDFTINTLRHQEALDAFQEASCVWTSPGLTTLLELISMGLIAIPLPPQNLSQALIIRHFANEGAPEIWNFLAKHYHISQYEDEERGVLFVQQKNRELLSDSSFIKNYIELAFSPTEQYLESLGKVVKNFSGIAQCANGVIDLLAEGK